MNLKSFVSVLVNLFFVGGVILIPAASKLFEFQDDFAVVLFGWLLQLIDYPLQDFSSDSQGMYLLLLIILVLAILIAGLCKLLIKNEQAILRLNGYLHVILIYYLASRMLVYGCDKLFATQFYQPEPNTLYTPFGFMTKDILYWSVMGTSKVYLIFTGLLEVVPAILLLFRKTRTLGLVCLVLVLTHVLMINIGFDISVKLYALFLFLMALWLLRPQLVSIFYFFNGKMVQLQSRHVNLGIAVWLRNGIKTLVIGCMLLESFSFVWMTGYLDDQEIEHSELYGAYEIIDDTSPGMIKRVFFHRAGYFITQSFDDDFRDYQLNVKNSVLTLRDYKNNLNEVAFELYDNALMLKGSFLHSDDPLFFRKLDYENLPALQDNFHWTTESFALK